MQATDYVNTWLGQMDAAAWVLHHAVPILLAAAACRVVTMIYNPHT